MQADGKRNNAPAGVTARLTGGDGVGAVEASISTLREIIELVDADTPHSIIRESCTVPLNALVERAGKNRDVNLLARLHALMSILEAEEDAAGYKDRLIAQISRVEEMLQDEAARPKPSVKGIIDGEQAPSRADLPHTPGSLCEDVLRSFPAIGDPGIMVLKEHGLLDTERLLNTDVLDLTRITGITTDVAFAMKDLLRRNVEEHARQDLARRLAELHMINDQLSAECERVAAANNTLLTNIKSVKTQYPVVCEEYDQEVKDFKALQSRVVSAQIESNRLSREISFLREKNQELLDLVEEKHLLLDDLSRRFTAIRSGFEFVNGETGYAQDIMTNVEGLLNKALLQKKALDDKIVSTEESIEKLFSEFNEVVRKGKTEFYRSV